MHTLRRNADDTYAVGFMRLTSNGVGHVRTDFEALFDNLKLYMALDAVNALNGGTGNVEGLTRDLMSKAVV